MLRYLSKRLLIMIPTFLGITVITFFIIKLAPGDPALMRVQMQGMGKMDAQMAAKIVEETRILYGLDQPIYVQYGKWLKRLVTLDFGESYTDHQPVLEKVKQALPITLLLNLLTIVIIYAISLPIGIITAMKPQSWLDYGTAVLLFVLYSLPSFWVAAILMTYLAGGDYLNLFPIMGISSFGADQLPWWEYVWNVCWHLVLPVTCLTYGSFAFLARFARSNMLEVIHQDFIRTARAKGLSEWTVIMRHGFRNSLVPMVSLLGTLLPSLLGGSVIIEQIFSIAGMGRLGFQSVLARDYPTIMAITAIEAFLTLVSMLIADMMYAVVDPRIRYGED
jgi:peptide/nickel transport system permease protein